MVAMMSNTKNTSRAPRPLRHAVLPLALVSAMSAGYAPVVHAQVASTQLPTGGSIAGGTGTINAPGASNTLVIDQTSNRMALTWSAFDIGSAATVRFNQPSTSAVVLNRITGGSPTQIFGNLNANGQVFISNSNGMIFGSTATFNVGGLVATTLAATPANFMSGNDVLDAGGNTVALMSNGGTINAAAGAVNLIGGKVVNNGTINATVGNIDLVGADRATLSFESGGFSVVITRALQLALDTLAVDNSGSLSAPGGSITLQARAASGIFDQLINNSGTIRASALSSSGPDGSVSLIASGAGGTAIAGSGSINVGRGSIGYSTEGSVQQIGVLTAGALVANTGGNVSLTGSNQIESISGDVLGNLSVSNARALGQTGGLSVGGAATFSLGQNALVLNNGANDFRGPVNISAGAATIFDANSMTLGNLNTESLSVTTFGSLNLGSGTVAGALMASSNGGAVAQSTNSGLTVTGISTINAGAGAITLTTGSNDFQQAVNLTGGSTQITDSNALQLGTVATGGLNVTSSGALNLGGGVINGALSATSGNGAITQSSSAGLTVTGVSTLQAGTGAITLANNNNDFQQSVSLSGGTTQIADSGALVLSTLSTGSLSARSSGALNLGTGSIGGNLNAVSNGGTIVQSGLLNVAGTSEINAGYGDISLGNDSNDFAGAVGLTGGAINVHDRNNLFVGSLVSGADKAVDLFSNATLTLGAFAVDTGNGSLRLASNGGALSTNGAVRGGAVTLRARDGVTLGHDVNAGSLLFQTGNSAVTQTAGRIDVAAGTTANTGVGAVNLTGAANNFRGAVNLVAGSVQINDVGALTLGSVTTGALSVTSGGALNLGSGRVGGNLVANSAAGGVGQAGGLVVTGTSSVSSGSGAIALANAGNDFQGVVALSGNGVSLRDANDLTISSLGTDGVGSISLVAGGALNLPAQAFNAGVGDLSLTSLGGGLDTVGALSGRNVVLSARDALNLRSDISASGSLGLTSTSGPVSQTGGSVVAGGASNIAGTNVSLSAASNDFQGLISLSGGSVQVSDANALNLGTLNAGNLTVRSSGALNLGQGTISGALTAASGTGGVTQSSAGVLTVLGATQIDAGTGAISLTQAGNSFAGQVGLRGGVAAISAAGDLRLGASTIDSLRAESVGSLALTGTINANSVDLATAGRFLNEVGSSSISPQARWRVYLQSPDGGHAFGGLDSGNTAIWNTAAFGTTAPGNRYVFAFQPTLSLTSTNASKVYGQLANLSGLFTPSGLMPGVLGAYAPDTFATATGGGAPSISSVGAARTANVGNSYAIDIGAGTLDTSTSGYGLAFSSAGRLSVTPAPLEVRASDLSKTYGDAVTPTGYSVQGLLNADRLDSVSLTSQGAPATASVNLGGYTIEASNADGLGLSNYTITYVNGLLTVGKAGLTIKANDASKTYGQVSSFNSYSVTGLRNSDSVAGVTLASDGAVATASAGNYQITADNADGTGLSNYEITYVDGILSVGKAGLTIRANDASKTYGDTSALAGFTVEGLLNSDSVSSVNLESEGAVATANVGGYTIEASGADGSGLSNYEISYADGLLTVGKAGLTITAGNASKTYGQTAVLTEFTAAGLRNQDSVGQVELRSDGASASASVGSYQIVADNADGSGLSNYDITYVDGVLSVGKAGLVIRANDASKTYGDTSSLAGYTAEGLVNGDRVTAVELASQGAAATANFGDYNIVASKADGQGLSNYDISYEDGTLSVGKAGLTISAADASKIYGEGLALTGYTVTGLRNADAVTGVELASVGTATTASVGGYLIEVVGADGAGLANYDISYVDGLLTVGKAGLTISAAGASKTYGQTLQPTQFTSRGLRNADTVNAVDLRSDGSTQTAVVGDYIISASGADGVGLSNYDITYENGVLSVGKAQLIITALDGRKTYGQNGRLSGYKTAGLVNADRVSNVELASNGEVETATVGRYSIRASGASGEGLANYDIRYFGGVLTVEKAGLIITASDETKRYGTVAKLDTYTVSGLVNADRVSSVDLASSGAPADALRGQYRIEATAAEGAGLTNYDVTYRTGTLSVIDAASQPDALAIARATKAAHKSAGDQAAEDRRPNDDVRVQERGIALPEECVALSSTDGKCSSSASR